jgi:hypothetical protein
VRCSSEIMKFPQKRLRLAVPLAAMGSVLFGMGLYFFQQREVFSEISSYAPPPKAEPRSAPKPTASPAETPRPRAAASRKEEPPSARTPLTTPQNYEEPRTEELSKLLPEEIRGAVAKEGGYVLTTSFGAKWYVTDAQVGQMPYDQQVLIDYGRYKREDSESRQE